MRAIKLAVLLILVQSCNNQADNKAVSDSTEAEIVYEEPQAPAFSQNFPELSRYLVEQDSTFNISRFGYGEVVSQDTAAAQEIDQSSLRPYLPFFLYNSDSSLALDLVSYNFIEVNRRGKKQFAFAGPDTEIGLIHVKEGKRKRILFMGSSGLVLDGKWESDDTILLAGAEETSDGKLRPLMWRYHVKTSELEIFSYPGTIEANAGEYFERKYNSNLRTTLSV